jgi:hypothetical protein
MTTFGTSLDNRGDTRTLERCQAGLCLCGPFAREKRTAARKGPDPHSLVGGASSKGQ